MKKQRKAIAILERLKKGESFENLQRKCHLIREVQNVVETSVYLE
jgi:hypothetical protein